MSTRPSSPDLREIEESLVKAAFLEPGILDDPDLDPEAIQNREVYEIIKAALALRARGIKPDMVTLYAELADHASTLARIGGLEVSAAQAPYFIAKINSAAAARRLRHILIDAQGRLDRGEDNVQESLEMALAQLDTRPAWSRVKTYSAHDEQTADLPPRQWFVDGMITVGLSIFAGRKGLGKSFAAIQLAIAVASGGTFLGRTTIQVRVLYLALELDRIAVHERLARFSPIDEGFDFVYTWPRGDQALTLLESAIKKGGYKVIVIDMLSGILPPDTETNSYDISFWLSRLRHIARDNSAAIIAMHHLIKADTGDPVSNLMGSTAFGGQADSVVTLDRRRGEAGAKVYVHGNHGQDLSLVVRFESCRWILADETDASTPRLAESDAAVVRLLESHPEGLSVRTIAGTLCKTDGAIRATLSRLAARGLVLKIANVWRYTAPHESAQRAPCAPGLFGEEAHRTARGPLGPVRSCAPDEPRLPYKELNV
jgi:hypothetical protein